MAGRQIKTPGVTESQQPEEQTKTEQTPETGTEQQVSEPTYEEIKESLIYEQNKHNQFLNDPELLEARLRELKPDLFTQQPSTEPVAAKRQRMVLGKDGWTKESY
ncbi:hypothetical protein [Acinetobacter sp. ULE_I092]|uniref:hypothetical protein n=1 Tax=Acinetobacter sp. ULE_I092 TaxID=3373075 RepID=UPI003AF624A7